MPCPPALAGPIPSSQQWIAGSEIPAQRCSSIVPPGGQDSRRVLCSARRWQYSKALSRRCSLGRSSWPGVAGAGTTAVTDLSPPAVAPTQATPHVSARQRPWHPCSSPATERQLIVSRGRVKNRRLREKGMLQEYLGDAVSHHPGFLS